MKVFKIKISSWSASFKFPNLISGYQPTLRVPPISTVLGIINASAGEYLDYKQLKLGYYFEYKSKFDDIETIYQVMSEKNQPQLKVKSNVIKREILFDTKLYIFLPSEDDTLVKYMQKPYYQILLGRMNDLASIDSIEEIDISENKSPDKIKGQIIPFNKYKLFGILQPLPKYFTNTLPRNNIGTEPYTIIDFNAVDYKTDIPCFTDKSLGKNGIDIFFHDITFDSNDTGKIKP